MKTVHQFLVGSMLSGMLLGSMFSCDKVDKPFPPAPKASDLDTTLYDGSWSEYMATKYPTFSENTNTNRNVLIEDFTGHTCNSCPPAAETAHKLETEKAGRVFVATIHTGPTGKGSLQVVQLPDYPTDWTNPNGLEIGTYFGSIPGSAFQGNPRGTINRVLINDQLTAAPNMWTARTNAQLTENKLNVNIQAKVNYISSTRGVFVHAEVDPIVELKNPLAFVAYVIQDSLIGDQKMLDGSHNSSYVHRTIMRGCLDNRAFGKELTQELMNEKGNYRIDYSYRLMDGLDPLHTHLLLYVYDKTTQEVYQVIESKLKE